MFDFHETPAPSFQLTDREIVMAASLTLSGITSAAFELLRHSASMEFDLGAIDLAALLCFPETFRNDAPKARGWVLEVLDILRSNDDES